MGISTRWHGDASDFDVLIVRAPADRSGVAVRLTAVSGFRLLPADHLMVWERAVPMRLDSRLPAGWSIATPQHEHDVVDVVRDSFEGYRSHYAMNPLFDAHDVLDGYCEWAATMYADERVGTLVVLDEHRVPVGVGLLDFAPDTPDIRLAGMRTLVQGHGHYSALMAALADVAEARGATGIQISTQSTNVRVMPRLGADGFRSPLDRGDVSPDEIESARSALSHSVWRCRHGSCRRSSASRPGFDDDM